jgi:hypothetical protein
MSDYLTAVVMIRGASQPQLYDYDLSIRLRPGGTLL